MGSDRQSAVPVAQSHWPLPCGLPLDAGTPCPARETHSGGARPRPAQGPHAVSGPTATVCRVCRTSVWCWQRGIVAKRQEGDDGYMAGITTATADVALVGRRSAADQRDDRE